MIVRADLPDEKLDQALRPQLLSDFTGQRDLRSRLKVSIEAARIRKTPLDHVLFSGPPGLGKTTLAAIIAREMGSHFHSTSAPALSRPGDLAKILTTLESGDVLFIDEIHRLNRTCEEILYPAMEDGFIDLIVGEGALAQSIKLQLKPFTLVGATTRVGMLTSPLKSRFGIDLKLEFYPPEDLSSIIHRSAALLELQLDEEASLILARRARMTPRIANRLLKRVRDYATVAGLDRITADFAESCLKQLGVDEMGLTETDRRLLLLMLDRYGGGPVGLRTLAALVDEDERTIEEDHEPFMLRAGLWEKTPQGRRATEMAARHLGITFPLLQKQLF